MKLAPDDPRLTAYILEELDPAGREAVGAGLQQSEAAYAEALEVYETATWLKQALKEAPVVELDPGRQATVEAAIETRHRSALRIVPAMDDEEAPTARTLPFPGRWRRRAPVAALAASLLVGLSLLWTRFPPAPAEVAGLETADLSSNPRATPPASPGEAPVSPAVPAPAATPPEAGSSGGATPPVPAPPPLTDLRMMMRYGLVPKGVTLPPDGASPPAPGTEDPIRFRSPSPAARTVERPDLGRTGGSRGANRPAPGTETYAPLVENPFLDPLTDPLSTFGVDVDRASFALVRRFLNEGRLPPREAVRIEELVNYFTYDYAPPRAGETFAVQLEAAGCPWNPGHRLVRVGLRTRDLAPTGRPPCNLVFLVDASGSMDAANKLPLLKQALRMLVERLRPEDSVAIVTYADHSRVVLPPTRGDRAGEILAVLDGLRAGGSTNGGSGLRSAYALARETFREGGVNRVILCTDGDFNVGITDPAELVRVIRDEARSGVFLSVLGFGVGNLKDATMERLADEGDGNYAYVDTLNEAHRVLVGQMNATLVTVALDVKAQVEFNPAQVQRYRLIGYENRLLAAAAFNDDRQDAGDVGAGHQVTALYELEPVPGGGHRSGVDPLKYQPGVARPRPVDASAETLTLKVRYRESAGTASRLLEVPAVDAGRGWSQASPDLRFAASVAAFGMVLRDSPHRGNATLAGVLELAREGLGADPDGNRAAFLELVRRAREIAPGR